MLSLPTVVDLNVSSTQWSSAYVDHLEANSSGVDGYRVPTGLSQVSAVPWVNIDQIRITFSEDVDVDRADLALSGVNQAWYRFRDFQYDANTWTAVWTLEEPIGNDRLLVDLDADGLDPVRDLDEANLLDGEWTDQLDSYPSGDGTAGGDFQFTFVVLPGDCVWNGVVDSVDCQVIGHAIGNQIGDPDYYWRYDIDGNGAIDTSDSETCATLQWSTAASGDPAGVSNDAPTTSGIAGVSVNEDAADTIIDLWAAFADNEDADSQLTYQVADNTNPGLFAATTIDAVAGTLTLDYAQDAYGTATLTVRATDTGGLSVEATFTVDVAAVNDPPTTSGIADVSILEDSGSTVIDLWAAFDDVEDPDSYLGYGLTGNSNQSLVVDALINGTNGTLTLDYAPNGYGTSVLTIEVIDTWGECVETSFTVDVAAVNDAPTTSGIADVSVNEDAADTVLDLFAAFADVEDSDSQLAYSITDNTNPALFAATAIDGAAGTLTLDYAQDACGTATLTARATDTGGAWVETTFTVTVAAVNDAPTTAGFDDVCVEENAADTVLDLWAAFADVEDSDSQLTYSITDNTNPALFDATTIDNAAGTLTLDYAQDAWGNGEMTIRATDTGGLWIETVLGFHVADQDNEAPSITFGANWLEGNQWVLAGKVTDPDDDVEGLIVRFGGVLESYEVTAIVQADGNYSETTTLANLQEGDAEAWTFDPHGNKSNVAVAYMGFS